MTAGNGHIADVVEGVIESANDRDVKVGGEWRNVSRFHPVELPDRGVRVRLELDTKGFIRSVQILDVAANASASTTTMRDREDPPHGCPESGGQLPQNYLDRAIATLSPA